MEKFVLSIKKLWTYPPPFFPFSSRACPLIPYNSRSTNEVYEKANKTIMFPRVPVELRLMVAILEPTVPTPLTPLTSLTIAEYTICCWRQQLTSLSTADIIINSRRHNQQLTVQAVIDGFLSNQWWCNITFTSGVLIINLQLTKNTLFCHVFRKSRKNQEIQLFYIISSLNFIIFFT